MTITKRLRAGLGVLVALVGLAAGCTIAGDDALTVVEPQGSDLTVTPVPQVATPTPEPAVQPPAGPTVAVQPDTPAAPDCSLVPTFLAADAVSRACLNDIAVSPELFARNAGWHVFAAADGAWVEVDYALTCCGDDQEATFVELLQRNGVDAAGIERLCADSGLSGDTFSGCTDGTEGVIDPDFEPTWLRVNGFGPHDFGTNLDVVLADLERIFGVAESFVEQPECGGGALTIAQWNDFAVHFADGGLAGWVYRSSTPALTSPSGVAPGISEAAIIEAYQGVRIFEESLGREFVFEIPAGYMGGIFDSSSGAVDAMFAGQTCFFR